MRHKAYVTVTAYHDLEGNIIPIDITWSDGRKWEIDQIRDVRRSASHRAGGYGTRYWIRIGQHETLLFREDDGRWFVEGKEEPKEIKT